MPGPKYCGPDCTAWFDRQLGIILKARQNFTIGGPGYQTIFKTLKFEEAGITSPNCQPNCTDTAGNNQAGVTFCGACLNVTELGNIAFGYAASTSVAPMIWGGFYAYVTAAAGNRGFDSVGELTSALMGWRLFYARLSNPNTSICTFLQGSSPFTKDQVEGITNAVYYFNKTSSVYFGDVCAKWEAKTKMKWPAFVASAMAAAGTPGAVLTSNAVANCNKCGDTYNGPDVVINPQTGNVTWPTK